MEENENKLILPKNNKRVHFIYLFEENGNRLIRFNWYITLKDRKEMKKKKQTKKHVYLLISEKNTHIHTKTLRFLFLYFFFFFFSFFHGLPKTVTKYGH